MQQIVESLQTLLQSSGIDVKYRNVSILLELLLCLNRLNRFQFYTYKNIDV